MTGWQYHKMPLNTSDPRRDDIDLLNEVGREGWELLAIANNNMAYLKRRIGDVNGSRKAAHAPKRSAASSV